jgi:hypothetical protein
LTSQLHRRKVSQATEAVAHLNEIINGLVEEEIISIQLYRSLKIFLVRLLGSMRES